MASVRDLLSEGKIADVFAKATSSQTRFYEKQQIVGDIVETGNLEYLKKLLEVEGDINGVDVTQFSMEVVVDYGHADLVRHLLEKRVVDVNHAMEGEKTMLVVAAEEGYLEVLKLLLEAVADVNLAAEPSETTAIHAAACGGHDECVEVLLKAGADVTTRNWFNSTALADAAFNGHDKCVELLIEAGANVGTTTSGSSTALHAAAKIPDSKAIESLLQAGANVNDADEEGETALMFAVNYILACNEGWDDEQREEVCKRCYEAAGADVNAASYGMNKMALILAVNARNIPCVELLIKAGADVDIKTTNGGSALTEAVYVGDVKCLKLLIEAGANLKAFNDCIFAQTLDMTFSFKSTESILECAKFLMESEADVKPGSFNTLSAAVLFSRVEEAKFLINVGADVNALGAGGKTVLAYATQMQRFEITELFLKAGADVNKADADGTTALIADQSCDLIKLLLKHGVLINKVNSNGQNSLTCKISSRYPRPDVIKLLYAAGENITDPSVEPPDWLPEVKVKVKVGVNLKELCREAVRKHLLNIDRHAHLFNKVSKLNVPVVVKSYLLYDVSLEDDSNAVLA